MLWSSHHQPNSVGKMLYISGNSWFWDEISGSFSHLHGFMWFNRDDNDINSHLYGFPNNHLKTLWIWSRYWGYIHIRVSHDPRLPPSNGSLLNWFFQTWAILQMVRSWIVTYDKVALIPKVDVVNPTVNHPINQPWLGVHFTSSHY